MAVAFKWILLPADLSCPEWSYAYACQVEPVRRCCRCFLVLLLIATLPSLAPRLPPPFHPIQSCLSSTSLYLMPCESLTFK